MIRAIGIVHFEEVLYSVQSTYRIRYFPGPYASKSIPT